MYRIIGWCPVPEMNGAGFTIALKPEIKEAVKKSGITQENINNWINTSGRLYLKHHGYNIPEDSPISFYIRISWGEWGIEHITVPGNACGLDIDDYSIGIKEGEKALRPHNVDGLKQASLILAVFTSIAETLEAYDENGKSFTEDEETKIERETESNAKVVDSFMEHCKHNGIEIPDTLFESFFNA
jgi:hypothetical protein